MNEKSRRLIGLVLGLLMGLVFGLVQELINPLFLPGIPLYNPGPGPAGSVLISCLGGGLLGLLAAWPEDVIPGVILSSLVGALGTTLLNLMRRSGGLDIALGLFVLLVITFLPRAMLFVPTAALIRWGLYVWSEEFQSVSFSIRKLALTGATIVFLAGAAGAFSLHTRAGRDALKTTNELIKAGMQAASADSLPRPLRSVDGFYQGAGGAYSLELSDNPDLLPVQRPIAAFGVQEYAVFVRCENGYRFGCAFTPPNPDPACQIF